MLLTSTGAMSPPPLLRYLILFFALAQTGCLEIPSTQVMAVFVADEEIAESLAEIELKVYGSSEGIAPELAATIGFTREDFPASVALVPNDPKDRTREFGLEAVARDEAKQTRAIVRARGRYMPDQARTAYLRFDSDCLDILHCSPDETCSLGRCLDAFLDDAEYGELGDGKAIPLPPIARPDRYTVHVGEPIAISPLENDRDPADSPLRIVDVKPWDSVPGGHIPAIIDEGARLEVRFPEYPGANARYVYTVANERNVRARALIELNVIDQDSDGDGIPDHIERASGCLDYLNPDTDADGIPDGVEDANRDGRVDPDETDPCRASTDGTGVCDGPPRASLPRGCHDFAVRFIDPARETAGEFDGRSWATAFLSIEDALAAEEGEVMPASRHYWIREGELRLAGPIRFIESQYQRVYGGFEGDEPTAAHRAPHHWTRLTMIGGESEPYVEILEAQSIVVDGFAFHDISPYFMSDPLPAPLVRVERSQAIRLSRSYFGEIHAETLVDSYWTTDLTLQELIVFHSRAARLGTGLFNLEETEGRILQSLFLNNPRREFESVTPINDDDHIGPVIRASSGSDADSARHLEIRSSSFYANKSTDSEATLIDVEAFHEERPPTVRLVDLRFLLPSYANLPNAAVHIRGARALEMTNIEIYDRSSRSDEPAGFSGATDQTIRAIDLDSITIRHLTNDAAYIAQWNRVLFAQNHDSERKTRIIFEDSVSTIDTPIYDGNGLLAGMDISLRRYCATVDFEYSPGLSPIPLGCPSSPDATGDSLIQALGIPLSQLSPLPSGNASPSASIAPGFHTRLAGPYFTEYTRPEVSPPNCEPEIRWSAEGRTCLILSRGLLPARVPLSAGSALIAFHDAVACFGEGPPVAILPPVEHDCNNSN